MKQRIVITDLTQMPKGNYACIAGIDESGQCIRPVTKVREDGVPKSLLYSEDQLIIHPRAKVWFNFHRVDVVLPHIEDQGFAPDSIVSQGLCSEMEWEHVLQSGSYIRVENIYDGFLQGRSWVKPGASTKSTATLSQGTIANVHLPEWEGKLKYRLLFSDSTGCVFDRPVSDLAFRELCYSEIKREGQDRLEVSSRLTDLLKSADRIYLRLGLARPWLQSKNK
ncbi:MAG: hypothetical protein J7K94_02830 [Dehalococcoidia bacterium]|nr:hypothetical protein [Dehalococcoidia bacterium]